MRLQCEKEPNAERQKAYSYAGTPPKYLDAVVRTVYAPNETVRYHR